MVPSFDESVHVDVLLDPDLRETRLQNLVVGHKLEALLGRPVHLVHGHNARIHDVQQLAGDAPKRRVFNLANINFQRIVNPLHNLLPAGITRHFKGHGDSSSSCAVYLNQSNLTQLTKEPLKIFSVD